MKNPIVCTIRTAAGVDAIFRMDFPDFSVAVQFALSLFNFGDIKRISVLEERTKNVVSYDREGVVEE